MNRRVLEVRKKVAQDPHFCELLERIRKQENLLEQMEKGMTEAQRNAVWDFFDLNEEINEYMLEIACGSEPDWGLRIVK